jgi:chromosome segregation ATPase
MIGAASASAKVTPVGKVVQLLGDLKAKVQKDLAAEEKAMEEYTSYCDDKSKDTQYNIRTAATKIEQLEAVIEGATAKISDADSTIGTSAQEISQKQSELASATDVREGEAKDFAAAEKELVDSVDMLARAAAVLKRELSFVQGAPKKEMKKKVANMLMGLSAIINAEWVSSAQSKKLKAFLEGDAEDDDLSLVQQPQAATYNYESKSGGIVDTINGMKAQAADQLAALRKAEMKAKFDYQLLSQSLNDSIKVLSDTVAEAKEVKAATENARAKAQEELGKTQAAKAADEEFLKTLTLECQNKASEWENRQKTAAAEMAALDKAKEVLNSGVKAMFVQVATSTHSSDEARSALVEKLRGMGRTYNSFALMQMASAAGSDPFVKIRGLVNEMIAKLEKQANEEATHEAFCQEEMAKTKKARETKIARVDKHQTRLDKATSAIASLQQEVAQLQEELAAMAKSLNEATKIRADEKAAYTQSKADLESSVAAVQQAIEVLSKFYGGASFVQQPTFGGARGDAAGGILSMLEVAMSDFSENLSQTNADEAEAVAAYEKMSQENAVSKATKEASVKGKTSEIASLKVTAGNSKSDLDNANKELDATMEYLDKLKPQCTSKAMTYAERKAKRDAEIAGLKEALDILSKEDGESFVQKKAFLSKVHQI